jgi:DNA-binding FrmR family transcriptional regulator
MPDLPHPHPEIAKRLKRAEGHLRTTIRMLEQGRECLDLAQQLQAIENAVAAAKKALIHDHLDHCLRTSAGRDAVAEFKAISRYL